MTTLDNQKGKHQKKAISIQQKSRMESITFSSLPGAPLRTFNCNTNGCSIKSGKQNKTLQKLQDNSSLETHHKKIIGKTYLQFNTQKIKIKELHNILKSQIQPQRQTLLNQLINDQKQLSSSKQLAKNYQFKSVELKSIFSKLKVEKDNQQQLLSHIIQNNLSSFAQIEQNQFQNYTLQKILEQLQQQNHSKTIEITRKKQKYQTDLHKFYLQINHPSSSHQCKQKSSNYSVLNDLQVQTINNFVQNASVHTQELRNCLSYRFQLLIKLKQSKNQKQTQVNLLNQQNGMLQEKIIILSSEIESAEQMKKEAMDQTADQQFKLNSVKMQNIELKARLQILQHSLNDQIHQSNQKKQMIKNQQILIDDARISSVHTSTCLEKLIALKIQSEYLQTRIKSSLSE